MRITKVYTRTGDAGKTRLAGGQEVWKDSLRVEAYGTVDELNASIGLARVFNADPHGPQLSESAAHIEATLRWVQNKLFDLGSLLATAPGQVFPQMPQVTEVPGPGCLRAPSDSRTNAVNCADVPGAMVSGPLISTAE